MTGGVQDEHVEVGGGRRMRLRRAGAEGPTVLLDAGWGHWSAVWAPVQSALEPRYRTVSFDRLGLGQSDASAEGRSTYPVVDELEAALRSAAIDGPIIYVAHSFAAVHAQTFVTRNPDVAGMVLVDPVVEALGVSKPFKQLRDRLDRSFKRLSRFSKSHLLKPAAHVLRIPPFTRKLPKAAAREFRSGYRPTVLATIREELAALEHSMTELARLQSKPVLCEVLSAEEDWLPGGDAAATETRVQSMHRKFASMSPLAEHQVVPGTGHDVHLDAPESVVAAVDRISERSRR